MVEMVYQTEIIRGEAIRFGGWRKNQDGFLLFSKMVNAVDGSLQKLA